MAHKSIGISPWLFEFCFEEYDTGPATDPKAIKSRYDWYLDLWTKAEPRGFEGIFFSEHHFGAGYSPSPNLLIAAMAGRTSTLRLGSIGTVSAYSTPWRVAEEYAMLDHLTGGRLELGVVSGIPPEFMAVNMSPAEARVQHAEVLDVLAKAAKGGPITHHGQYWNFENLRLVPSFYQSSPSIWTAVRVAESAENSARHGFKACAGFNSTADISSMFDRYRAAASDHGQPHGPDRLALRRLVTFVEDDSARIDGVLQGKQAMLEILTRSVGPLPPFAAILDRPEIDNDMLSNDEFVSGTPDQVAEQLIDQCRAVGAGHMAIMFSPMDRAGIERHHELFAETVIPALRRA